MVLIVNGSALYLSEGHGDEVVRIAELLTHRATAPTSLRIPNAPAALSLNIAQACNLSCRYCYADEGRFGGEAKMMSEAMAIDAVQRHLDRAGKGRVSIGFIGGEPLLNRRVLHRATQFAAAEAARRAIPLTFGITTNGTLLRSEDIDLLRSYPFAVTVSLDGSKATHDLLRPDRKGSGSFDQALGGIAPLLLKPGQARVAARVTLTHKDLDVPETVDALSRAGFSEIGVSPLRTGLDAELRVQGSDWEVLLSFMKAAAMGDWTRSLESGGALRFSNFSTALRQLFQGACNALPCGAAANYVSLGADGRYYTCHRTVGDEGFEVGTLVSEPSFELRDRFIQARSVDRQEPCRACWARYLCGGGCHAEVMSVGRAGCDFIRGWLEFCISIYPEILSKRPDLLGRAADTI